MELKIPFTCKSNLKSYADWFRDIKRPLCILFILYFLGTFAIIRANFMYMDDLARVSTGYRRWTNFSRYLSEYLSPFLHGDVYLTDVSPMPQLLALLICALSGICTIRIMAPEKKITFLMLVASLPICLNPYFLQCLSYKYDSPYMALSILLSIVPLLFRDKNPISYLFVSMLGILGSCTSYQASMGIYPTLVILVALLDWSAGKKNLHVICFIMISALSFALTLLLFNLFIANPVETYVNTTLLPLESMLPGATKNLTEYFKHVRGEFEKEWIILMAVIAVCFVTACVMNTRRNSALVLILALAAVILMLLLTFGGYPILEKPSYSNRSKYGIGVMIGFLAVAVATSPKAYLGKLASVALSWCFFIFSFAYGNGLYMQAQYTDFRASMIAEDLAELECVQSGETVTVHINGTIGLAPAIENAKAHHTLLRTIYVPLDDDGWWGSYHLLHFYGLDNLKHGDFTDPAVLQDAVCTVDNAYHSLYTKDQNVYVLLK